MTDGLEIAETTYQAEGWEKPRRIVMAYNFMSLFRHALINSDKKKFLKTIRYELISTPAYLGKTKDKHILYLARSLKTRRSFLSIWEKLKDLGLNKT